MNYKSRIKNAAKQFTYLTLAALLAITISGAAVAQEEPEPGVDKNQSAQQFGGPSSVPGQQADDERLTESLTGKLFCKAISTGKTRCERVMA